MQKNMNSIKIKNKYIIRFGGKVLSAYSYNVIYRHMKACNEKATELELYMKRYNTALANKEQWQWEKINDNQI